MSKRAERNLAVDIVINNFNYGEYLAAAIESALAQNHSAVRVIVVDDGSRDNSAEVIDAYEPRLDAVIRKPNGGQASALNAGFELCEGEIVIFLDADDVLMPDAAARVAAAFAANRELVKVQYRAEVIDAAGRPTGELKPAPHLPAPQGDLRRAELAYPFDLVWMATSANAFRHEALRRLMPIPEQRFRRCPDWYLVHLVALLGPVRSLDEVGAGYRIHGANSYEPQSAEVDLAHLRDAIEYAAATTGELLRLAGELELPRPEEIFSLADLANRMISLRLDPERHPLAGDRRIALLIDAVRAAHRRDNASRPVRAAFIAWFTAVAVAPRPLVRRLAAFFLFPERRGRANDLLGRLQRSRAERTVAA